MFNLKEIFVMRRRKLIIDRFDLEGVLTVIDNVKHASRFYRMMNMELGSYASGVDNSRWYIHFDATDKQWKQIIKRLDVQGKTIALRDDNRFYLI